jgi:hypothetical protein
VQAALLQQQAAHSKASPQTDSPLPWPSPTACKAFALGLLHMLAESTSAGGRAVCSCTLLVPKDSKCQRSGDSVPHSWSLTADLGMTLI